MNQAEVKKTQDFAERFRVCTSQLNRRRLDSLVVEFRDWASGLRAAKSPPKKADPE